MKEEKIELESLKDLELMIKEAKEKGVNIIIIGGFATRAYTHKTLRYSKDIDFVVKSNKELQKLKFVLGKLKYKFRDAEHGISGFKRIEGVPIVLNISVDDVEFNERKIKAFYKSKSIKTNIITIEELLVSKTLLSREKDIIDVCIILLDSYDKIDLDKLKQVILKKDCRKDFLEKFKYILNIVNTKDFRMIWKDFMKRGIRKEEETNLLRSMSSIIKSLK